MEGNKKDKIWFELATSNRIYNIGLKIDEILRDYTCDFELNGSMPIGSVGHKTSIRLKIWMVLKIL